MTTELTYILNGRGKQSFSHDQFVTLVHDLYLHSKRQFTDYIMWESFNSLVVQRYVTEGKCSAFTDFNYLSLHLPKFVKSAL